MKNIVFIGVLAGIVASAHFAIQSIVDQNVAKTIDERLASIAKKSNQELVGEYGRSYFDYLTLSAVVEDVNVYIGGKPGMATVKADKYFYNVMDKSATLKDVSLLSTTGSTGAVSMAEMREFSISGDPLVEAKDFTSLSLIVVGLKASNSVYKNMFAPEFFPLAKAFFDQGIDIEYQTSKSEQTSVSFYINVPEMIELTMSGIYSSESIGSSGTFVDPDTGQPLKVGADSGSLVTLAHSFGVKLEDKGVRDSVFRWGASLSESPSVTDYDTFKNGIVKGIDSYVNQVIPYDILPNVVLNEVVSFVNDGSPLNFHIDLNEPTPFSLIQTHLMGLGDQKVFENANVRVD